MYFADFLRYLMLSVLPLMMIFSVCLWLIKMPHVKYKDIRYRCFTDWEMREFPIIGVGPKEVAYEMKNFLSYSGWSMNLLFHCPMTAKDAYLAYLKACKEREYHILELVEDQYLLLEGQGKSELISIYFKAKPEETGDIKIIFDVPRAID